MIVEVEKVPSLCLWPLVAGTTLIVECAWGIGCNKTAQTRILQIL